jgi:hypothetical protein
VDVRLPFKCLSRPQILLFPMLAIKIPPYLSDGSNYSLTPWSRVLLKKLTGLQVVKNFPEFY